jgi:hypothetical protein
MSIWETKNNLCESNLLISETISKFNNEIPKIIKPSKAINMNKRKIRKEFKVKVTKKYKHKKLYTC